jgi:hypothetical protein
MAKEQVELPEEEEDRDSLVEIDEFNLDREWLVQAKLFRRWAFKVADLKLRVAERKAALDLVKAELSLAIRSSPDAFGLKKATDAAVAECVLTQSEYKEALRKYNRARHALDQHQAVVEALEHRKAALEGWVKLHGQGYFAEPREPKGSNIERDVKRRVRAVGTKKRKTDG